MKTLIFVSLIAAAIALPKPAVIEAPIPEQENIVESIPSIKLQTPVLPKIDNNEADANQVNYVESEHEEAIPFTDDEDTPNVVIAPEEGFEKITPLDNEILGDIKVRILERLGDKINNLRSNNNAVTSDIEESNDITVVQEPEVPEIQEQVQVVDTPIFSEIGKDDNIISDFVPQELFDKVQIVDKLNDFKGKVLETLVNKLNTIRSRNTVDESDVTVVKEPEVQVHDQIEGSDFSVVQEPENPEFNDQVQVEDSDVSVVQEPENPEFNDQVQVEDSDVSVVQEPENPEFNNQVQVEDSDVSVVQEPENPEFNDQVQVEDSDVSVVQEPENPEFNSQVQVEDSDVSVVQEPENPEFNVQIEDSQISGIAQDDNIISDFVPQEFFDQVQVDHLKNLRDQVLEALVNKFNTFNNVGNDAVEPVVPEFHDHVQVVDSPILPEIAENDLMSNFNVQESIKVVNEPIFLSNHIVNHGFEPVHIVNNPFLEMLQAPHIQQEVIIVRSPQEIIEALHKIIEHVQVVDSPAFNQPPRIYKFQNPLLR